MDTPCVNICYIDPKTQLCEGCGRSLEQIGRWREMSAQERREIMAKLQNQNEALKVEE